MENKQQISYSKYYKPKGSSKLLPEYMIYAQKNRDKQDRINYRQFYNVHK